ncbi:MAG: type 4a pilus biogenesis protein PilO [Planctomycetota bacterium]
MMQSRFNQLAERLGTSTRCHMLGAAVSSLLVIAIFWLWSDPVLLVNDPKHSPEQLAESIRLISSGSALRNEYQQVMRTRDETQVLVDDARQWLPTSIEWTALRTSLQAQAIEHGLDVISLERGNEHKGERVSVLDVHCELEGSYLEVCQFLEALAAAKRPMWCDEIRLQREDNEIRSGTPGTTRCLAVLSLRAPFAGEGTVGERLLKMETIR